MNPTLRNATIELACPSQWVIDQLGLSHLRNVTKLDLRLRPNLPPIAEIEMLVLPTPKAKTDFNLNALCKQALDRIRAGTEKRVALENELHAEKFGRTRSVRMGKVQGTFVSQEPMELSLREE